MEKINWFPGHMKKALDIMSKEVKNVDALIYVLDSRAPFACLNPEFVKIVGNKPILFVLNKIDLADEAKIKEIKKNLLDDNRLVVELNSTASGAIKTIQSSLEKLCFNIFEKYKSRGINPFIRAMVIGVPNCGKSTLVNNLCGGYKATTGNKPGVTKAKQWVKISKNLELLDTPGTLWPNLSNQEIGKKLAFIGSIKDEVISSEDLALLLIEELRKEYKTMFENRFAVETNEKSSIEILEEIAKKRKYLIKGGEVDYERTAKAIIDDFRKGKIGKITL